MNPAIAGPRASRYKSRKEGIVPVLLNSQVWFLNPMAAEPDYRNDLEFTKLLARRSDVNLTIAALEIARDAYPELDFATTLDWIDARGHELSGPVAKARDEHAVIAAISECLAETHGLGGDDSCFENPDSSYLNRVIETSHGLPISLSVLYMAVAERVRVDLRGVSSPRHFLLCYESAEGPLFIDPFSGGRMLDEATCARWIGELSGLEGRKLAAALKPVDARTIVIRMLNNLKALYVRLDKWRAAWKVQRRLSALQPASYDERRDLALISLRANHTGRAIDLLKSCLKMCAEEEKETLQLHLDEAGGQLARWN